MTALAPSAPRRLVLADRVFPRHLVVDITLVVLGAAFVGGLAQLYVPLWPVPVTGRRWPCCSSERRSARSAARSP